MDDPFFRMRDIIMVTENLDVPDIAPDEPTIEPMVETGECHATLLQEFADVIFKLRAFSDPHEGDVGLGTELGMQRAADMIENVIRRHTADGEHLG